MPVSHHCAGGVIFTRNADQIQFLLIKQIQKNGNQQWISPKGHIKSKEDALTAARREVAEEVGLTDLILHGDLGQQTYTYTKKKHHSKIIQWYLFECQHPEQLTLSAEEGFVEAVWQPYDQAKQRSTYDNFPPFLLKALSLLTSIAPE